MKKLLIIAVFLLTTLFCFGQIITQVGYYSINGVVGLDVKDEYMILSNGQIVSNAVPSSSVLTSQYSIPGDGITVLVDGDFAYFGTGQTNELFIADISNISFPIHQGSLNFSSGNGIFGMAIANNTLLLVNGFGGIVSIDVSNKANPVIQDMVSLSGQTRDICIQNNYGFAAHEYGLKVVDFSNPSNLQVIASAGSGYNSIDINGNLVFLGKSNGGIDVFDISNPSSPSPAFSIPNSGSTAWDLKYHNNHLYLATNSSGLFIYELQANAAIQKAHFPNTGNGQSFGVAIQDSLVLLSGLVNGVAILNYDDSGTVGVHPIQEDSYDVTLYPNPARHTVSFEHNNMEIKRICIYDVKGSLLKQFEGTNLTPTLDVSDLSKGEYLFSIETDQKNILKKVIKIE